MKQDIAEFLVDSFIDYKGDEHKVVLCALSQTPEKSIDDDNLMVVWSNGYDVDETADICHEVLRTVSLGIAICCPADKKAFSEEIGKKIALNRAEKSIPKFVSLEPGVVNTTVVRAFLEQEMTFVKRCPEKFIKGYDEAKAHYNKKLNLDKTVKNLSPEEAEVVEFAMNGIDILKCAKLARQLLDRRIHDMENN
jgi:hypothetical protein